MPRGIPWPLAAVVALACTPFGCGPPGEAPPNVVLISIDTLRHDFVGCGGAPEGTTPTLDRIARQGVVFSNAVSTTSWTLPSHVSILTGQYIESHGVHGDETSLHRDRETIAEFLRDRRYRTGGFWSGPYLHPAFGFGRGFETYGQCVNYRIELDDEGRVSNTAQANMYSRYGVTGPKTHAKVDEWLRSVPVGTPYFLFAHYWDPHADFEAPPPYDRFLDDGYDGPMTGRGMILDERICADMPEADRKRLQDLYRGEIRWTDAWIGRIVKRLEERGELDRTLLIIVADHGEEFFEHGRKGHRQNLYEKTLRVPLLVRYPPAFPAGRVVDALASLVDVFPTVTGLVGVAAAGERQGVDLARLAAGEDLDRAVFAELGHTRVTRGAQWKAILDERTGDGELYSLVEDPAERRDVREERPEIWEALEKARQEHDPARFAAGTAGSMPELDEGTEDALRALGYTD